MACEPSISWADGLAHVVDQRRAFRLRDVDTQFRRHQTGQMADLFRVLEHVLTVRSAVMQAAQQFHDFGVQAVHVDFEAGLFPVFANRFVDLFCDLLDDFFDPRGMNAPIRYEPVERLPRNFAANGIEPGQDDRLRRVVDDDVNAGRVFERADVPPFTADDTALHFVVGKCDHGNRRFGDVVGGTALDGLADNPAGLFLGILGEFVLKAFQA